MKYYAYLHIITIFSFLQYYFNFSTKITTSKMPNKHFTKIIFLSIIKLSYFVGGVCMKKINWLFFLELFLEISFIGCLISTYLDIKHKQEVKSLVKEAEKKKD